MNELILQTTKLCKTFSSSGNQQHVLKNLDLQIKRGDFTVIMGASGSGKSTLLYALSGMDKPSLGQVVYAGTDITKLSQDELARFRRRHCGFIFQQIHLMDHMSVLDNILTAGLLTGTALLAVSQKARELLKQFGLTEQIWTKFPAQLSGGEAQRAGIVRALINAPEIIFADEPTGALNHGASIQVLDAMTDVNQQGQSIVMVTHDQNTAIRGSRIIYLRDGVVCGECHLTPYRKADIEPERSRQLAAFLKEMRW